MSRHHEPSAPVRQVTAFEQVFNVMHYPAGESHVEARVMIPSPGVGIIVSHCRGFEDLCNILVADEILMRNDCPATKWFIPYFPFGRHDRRRHRLDGMELTIALNMVKDLNVVTLDPHSDVSGVLPHIPQREVVRIFGQETDLFEDDPVIVIPDSGATKKAYEWIGQFDRPADIVQCGKRRDPGTGELTGFEILSEPDRGIAGRPYIIVDDICDGGGTFLGLADVLHERGLRGGRLLVTHGLFTKGIHELDNKFDKIYTTGPFQQDGVTRIPQHTIYEWSQIV